VKQGLFFFRLFFCFLMFSVHAYGDGFRERTNGLDGILGLRLAWCFFGLKGVGGLGRVA
jgi:hypothetical protein